MMVVWRPFKASPSASPLDSARENYIVARGAAARSGDMPATTFTFIRFIAHKQVLGCPVTNAQLPIALRGYLFSDSVGWKGRCGWRPFGGPPPPRDRRSSCELVMLN